MNNEQVIHDNRKQKNDLDILPDDILLEIMIQLFDRKSLQNFVELTAYNQQLFDNNRKFIVKQRFEKYGISHIYNKFPVKMIKCSPNGDMIGYINTNNIITIRNIHTDKVLGVIRGYNVHEIVWSNNSTKIIIISDKTERNFHVFDIINGKQECSLMNDDNNINDDNYDYKMATWDHYDNKIITETNGIIKIWDSKTGALIQVLEDFGGIYEKSWSPNGTKIALKSWDNTIKIYDTNNYQIDKIIDNEVRIKNIGWHSNCEKLTIYSQNGIVKTWNVITGDIISNLNLNYNKMSLLNWNYDHTRIITYMVNDNEIKIWDGTNGNLLYTLKDRENYRIYSLTCNKEGTKIITADSNHTIKQWKV